MRDRAHRASACSPSRSCRMRPACGSARVAPPSPPGNPPHRSSDPLLPPVRASDRAGSRRCHRDETLDRQGFLAYPTRRKSSPAGRSARAPHEASGRMPPPRARRHGGYAPHAFARPGRSAPSSRGRPHSLRCERPLDAEEPSLPHQPSQHPPEDVAPALVAGQHAVRDQEHHPPAMVCDDPQRAIGARIAAVDDARNCAARITIGSYRSVS